MAIIIDHHNVPGIPLAGLTAADAAHNLESSFHAAESPEGIPDVICLYIELYGHTDTGQGIADVVDTRKGEIEISHIDIFVQDPELRLSMRHLDIYCRDI